MVSVAEEKEHEEEEEEEFEKLDLSDTLAPAVVMREVGNINDLPEELLLEIFLCLPPAPVLEVCYIISSRSRSFQISYHRNSFRYKCHNLHTINFLNFHSAQSHIVTTVSMLQCSQRNKQM